MLYKEWKQDVEGESVFFRNNLGEEPSRLREQHVQRPRGGDKPGESQEKAD